MKRIFSNHRLKHERDKVRPIILRACADAGMHEAYQFYLPLLEIDKEEIPVLDNNGKPIGASHFHPTVTEEYAKEIVDEFASEDPEIKKIVKKFPKTRNQIPELKKWLQTKATAGKQ